MTRQEFIEIHNTKTDKVNEIIQNVSEDLEIDWRDQHEVEIHNFDMDETDLIENLNNEGFKVEVFDYRYSTTLRIFFEDPFFGSFGLEDFDESDWKEFNEVYR